LSYRPVEWVAGCLLLLFYTAWSAGTGGIVWKAFDEPGYACFAVPFVTAWFAVLFFMLWAFFANERLTLTNQGLIHRRWNGVLSQRRQVPLAELKGVREGTAPERYSTDSAPE